MPLHDCISYSRFHRYLFSRIVTTESFLHFDYATPAAAILLRATPLPAEFWLAVSERRFRHTPDEFTPRHSHSMLPLLSPPHYASFAERHAAPKIFFRASFRRAAISLIAPSLCSCRHRIAFDFIFDRAAAPLLSRFSRFVFDYFPPAMIRLAYLFQRHFAAAIIFRIFFTFISPDDTASASRRAFFAAAAAFTPSSLRCRRFFL